MKKCAHCNEYKSLDSFGKRNRKKADGSISYNCYCKLCNSQRAKDRYAKIKSKGLKFVYRLINEDNEVVYVGKTESLPTRTNQHFSKNGHLYPKIKNEKLRLQYIAMKSTSLMQIREIYYINIYKPKYNTIFMNDEPSIHMTDFSTDVWLDYTDANNIIVQDHLNVKNEFIKVYSIFKRKRGNRFLVYVEIDYGNKRKQIKKGSFLNEIEADNLVSELKKQSDYSLKN